MADWPAYGLEAVNAERRKPDATAPTLSLSSLSLLFLSPADEKSGEWQGEK